MNLKIILGFKNLEPKDESVFSKIVIINIANKIVSLLANNGYGQRIEM
jgi:hypothetical protein